jgi:hypothetical protein
MAVGLAGCGEGSSESVEAAPIEVDEEARDADASEVVGCETSESAVRGAVEAMASSPWERGANVAPVTSFDVFKQATPFRDAQLGVIRELVDLTGTDAFHPSGTIVGQAAKWDGYTAVVEVGDTVAYAQLVTGMLGPAQPARVDLTGLVGACAVILTSASGLDGRSLAQSEGPRIVAVAARPDAAPVALYGHYSPVVDGHGDLMAVTQRAKDAFRAP